MNLFDVLEEGERRFSDKDAIRFPNSGGHASSGRNISYQELTGLLAASVAFSARRALEKVTESPYFCPIFPSILLSFTES